MWFHRHKLWKTLPNRTGQIYVTPMALCGSLKSSPGHQRCKWPLGKGWGCPVSRPFLSHPALRSGAAT